MTITEACSTRLLRWLSCLAVLPALLTSPVLAARPDGLRVCSGNEVRYILVNLQDRPDIPRQRREDPNCAHATCPRRGDSADDDDEAGT